MDTPGCEKSHSQGPKNQIINDFDILRAGGNRFGSARVSDTTYSTRPEMIQTVDIHLGFLGPFDTRVVCRGPGDTGNQSWL